MQFLSMLFSGHVKDLNLKLMLCVQSNGVMVCTIAKNSIQLQPVVYKNSGFGSVFCIQLVTTTNISHDGAINIVLIKLHFFVKKMNNAQVLCHTEISRIE